MLLLKNKTQLDSGKTGFGFMERKTIHNGIPIPRKESSMSVRKESVINNSSTTNVLHTERSEPVPEEAAKVGYKEI